ncbi:sensor histidine kinase [Neorhizobium galegae]|uniref:sensor histidine kinase n=1 Tax=Neorhizobium galegae TaxID=399 RepID=UPI0006227710|nr:histidine kinase dimerization/phosphoacceptor domain -containing protein [Neorhizobium galegae]CDZ60067.1 Sensory transduction regulatory protein [Neorhizobium galegae bv. orientalis]KAB1121051.1 histidine kinase [Neorhizobium galegae]MCQ1574613.1 ATP-binding protein [Neorhizobium galegae]MCQ1808963.1 ATP-binding protein [Neorhizobium galegae]MCQ1838803.1 ATP-binding protein [Neorhizobium galegae]
MFDFRGVEDAQTLAQAIVNTIHDPLLVLDERFSVLAASRSFYETFNVDAAQTQGRLLYSLGDGQWDIPALRTLLETIIPARTAMDGFEVEHNFPGIGRRTMLLNARQVVYAEKPGKTILLAFTDISARRLIEREKEVLHERTEDLLHQKEVLLQEMQHRVANSLQIIASILLLKARAVTSDETRRDLHDAHQRVLSVAEVQKHLHQSGGVDQIEVASYLTTLCHSLGSSMTGESQPILIRVMAQDGKIGSDQAVSLGLIVTELVINAVKYAFPYQKAQAAVLVSYEVSGSDWKLTVSDNGVGKDRTLSERAGPAKTGGGLGTAIVTALVRQLGAQIEMDGGNAGTTIVITRATFLSRPPSVD